MRRCRLLFLAAVLALLTASGSSVVFHGGAGHVGGSCATVRSGDFQLLVDCGTDYGSSATCGFPFDTTKYQDLLLTHAHQDHVGRVPELFSAGFTGTVWTTSATRELLAVVWKSQIMYDQCSVRAWRWTRDGKKAGTRVHWHPDCEWSQKIAPKNLETFRGIFSDLQKHLNMTPLASDYAVACRTCQELELKTLLAHVKPVAFDTPVKLGPFSVTFTSVKHLPGAAAIRLEDAESSVLFSGDLGTLRSHLVKSIAPAQKADAVFIESTYGDVSHGSREEVEREYVHFIDVIGKTVRKGGVAWIPAFALDRSQRVLLEIQRGMNQGLIPPETPIHYLSPSSRDCMALYVSHPEWFDNPEEVAALGPLFKRTRKSFSPNTKRIQKTGAILLTTSGTMSTGYSLKFIPDLLPRETTSLCLVGYQSPGTYGQQLQKIAQGKSKKTSIRVKDGEETRDVPIKASIYDFSCFSGHGDATENDAWLINNRDSRIFLVHGSESDMKARAEGLRKRFGSKVEIVEPGREYHFRKTAN